MNLLDSTSHGRRVFLGTCGWSDSTLIRCKRFYPTTAKTADERLRYYSGQLPCVEVDTSAYAIPWRDNVQKWLTVTPKGFLFHFKSFGLFTAQNIAPGAIPKFVREKLSPALREQKSVRLNQLTTPQVNEIWSVFNGVLGLVYDNERLGVVIFQFHLSFTPTDANRAHIKWCRQQLDARFEMACEFRARAWFDSANAPATTQLLTELKCGLIAADELAHETFMPGEGLAKGKTASRLPIAMIPTISKYFYVRVHRREGDKRQLAASEYKEWAERLATVAPALTGPVFFLVGTDWEDQSILNIRGVDKAVQQRQAAATAAANAAAAASEFSAAAAGGSGSGGDSKTVELTPSPPSSASSSASSTPPASQSTANGCVLHYSSIWKSAKKSYGLKKLASSVVVGAAAAAGAGTGAGAAGASPVKDAKTFTTTRPKMTAFFKASSAPATNGSAAAAAAAVPIASSASAAASFVSASAALANDDAGGGGGGGGDDESVPTLEVVDDDEPADGASASAAAGAAAPAAAAAAPKGWADATETYIDDRPSASQMPPPTQLQSQPYPPAAAHASAAASVRPAVPATPPKASSAAAAAASNSPTKRKAVAPAASPSKTGAAAPSGQLGIAAFFSKKAKK